MRDYVQIYLRSNKQYRQILELLRFRTTFIEFVPVCPNEDVVLRWALRHLELLEKGTATNWHGALGDASAYTRYLFRWDETVFRYFMSLHNFFIYYVDPDGVEGDRIYETEFYWTDVTFFDEEMKPLFFTITHEGDALLHNSLIDLYKITEETP